MGGNGIVPLTELQTQPAACSVDARAIPVAVLGLGLSGHMPGITLGTSPCHLLSCQKGQDAEMQDAAASRCWSGVLLAFWDLRPLGFCPLNDLGTLVGRKIVIEKVFLEGEKRATAKVMKLLVFCWLPFA